MRIRLPPYGFIRIPYGRSRPIDFDRSHFYAQHLDDEELARFLNKIGSTSIAARKRFGQEELQARYHGQIGSRGGPFHGFVREEDCDRA